MIDKKIEAKISTLLEIITSIRNMRQELEIPVGANINVVISTGNKENRQELKKQL